MKTDSYNIGLDIGTNSVGWAVIDDQYNLLKKKKKNLFGVFLFYAGQPADVRRAKRSMRRRLERRRQRLALLRELFAEEMQKVDPSFFLRLSESKLNKNDVNKHNPGYIIFNDEDYTDKDFYEKYPTIYHLQKAMIEQSNTKFDLRELYLVASHIIKYRGNFTDEAQTLEGGQETFSDLLNGFNTEFERQGYGTLLSEEQFDSIQSIAQDETKNASDRQKELVQLIVGSNKDKTFKTQATEFAKLILGLKGDFAKLFLSEDMDSAPLKLSDRNVDTQLETVVQSLTAEQNIILEQIQQIYSKIVLHKILKEEQYLSFARVKSYEKHKIDLKDLKKMWDHDVVEHPDEVAKAKKAYDNYIHHGKFAEDFYKEIQSYLSIAEDKAAVETIKEDILINNYLPKQRTNQNGAIPFQIYQKELKQILTNQSKFYPFLLVKDSKGLSVLDKVLSIHSFRIPYYVGPLTSKKNSKFAWMVRREEGKIYPWNFDKKIDRDESSINFISQMTGTDTYLLGEPVVPKYSLLYQKYEVLNELNKIRVNDYPLEVSVKQAIFNDVFKNKRTVNVKTIREYLIQKHGYSSEKTIEISGLSKITEFSSSLSTYQDLVKVFGVDFVDSPLNYDFLEQIVTWLTVFEDKKILNRRLKDVSDRVTPQQAKKLLQYRYTGWGRLSRKLLSELKVVYRPQNAHQETEYSLMDLLWQTNMNLMQIINDNKVGLNELIKEQNGESSNSTFESINDLGGSPAIKKGIRQTVRVIDDIVKVMGKAPKRIYIEFARDDQVSSRTNSRYKQLKDKYAEIKKMSDSELPGLLANIKSDKSLSSALDENQKNLSSEKLFLYFLQGGKSLYSGKTLDINSLHEYEVDHILPQNYIKDDSIENKALVLKSENQYKTGKLLLPQEYIQKMASTWLAMKNSGLITSKKYNNLTRVNFSENQMKGFINRQLVETRQIIKNVANILDDRYAQYGTKTVPVKANLSMEFRKKFDLPKSRNVNDYHHAHDAYIAALLGTYIGKKYPNLEDAQLYSAFNKYLEEQKDKLRKEGKLGVLRQSYIISQLSTKQSDKVNDELVWDPSVIDYVRKVFQYKQINIVKKTEINNGEFFDISIKCKKDSHATIPQKKGMDPKLYGGRSNENKSFSVLVRKKNKNKLIAVPVQVAYQNKFNLDKIKEWILKEYKLSSDDILIDRVPVNQKIISLSMGNLILVSDTEVKNGKQLILSAPSYKILSKLEHILQFNNQTRAISFINQQKMNLFDIYQEIVNKASEYPAYTKQFKQLEDTDNMNAFIELGKTDEGIIEQFFVIEEMLNLTHFGQGQANFKSILLATSLVNDSVEKTLG